MGLRARILAVTSESGPRSRNILRGLARGEKQQRQFDAVLQSMLDKREIVMQSDKRGAKYGPPRQRGEIQVLMVATLITALLGCAAYFVGEYRGTVHGRAEVQSEWDNKKLEEARFTREREAERDKRFLEEQRKRAAAERRATTTEATLEEAKREARRNGVDLVACRSQPGPDQGAAGTGEAGGRGITLAGAGSAGVGGDRGARAVFTWEFVRQFDGGWSGLDGEPLSGLAAGDGWPERAGTPSPYLPQDVVDVAEANAIRCSKDRRELAELIVKIERAADEFDKVRP